MGCEKGFSHRHGRRGFSLIELMIALTILGLGLVLVATMFPVAWSRARKLSEFTTQQAVKQSAELTIRLLTRVDGPGSDVGSFAGDLIYDPIAAAALAEPETRVHALFLENILVDAPRSFTPDRVDICDPDDPRNLLGFPWMLELMEGQITVPPFDLCTPQYVYFFDDAFGGPQVRFEQRVYPPMNPRDGDTVNAAGQFTDPDPLWDEALDRRRFAWAVFHRLRDAPMDPEDYPAFAAGPRVLDIYYVTLKRTRPTLRYAQQDPDPDRVPDPIATGTVPLIGRGVPVAPAALPAENDVLLPVPWRVQVAFPDDLADAPANVPTEIAVVVEDPDTAAFVIDFFAPGTPFIDEVNGQVYRVLRRRIVGKEQDEAFLTLDRQVVVDDIDDGHYDPDDDIENHFGNNDPTDPNNDPLQLDELVRTVWVFPPPVQATRLAGDLPVFEGKQPVIGIDIRKLTISP